MPKQLQCDKELVKSYINGNESALHTLIERHKKLIYSQIKSVIKEFHIADDIFQETFFKAIIALKQGQYNENGKFKQWIIGICHNCCIDYYRNQKRIKTITTITNNADETTDILNLLRIEDKCIEDKILRKQLCKEVRQLVVSLPVLQRNVVVMRYYYDMSYDEIAQHINLKTSSARGLMQKGLVNLKEMAMKKEVFFQ